MTKQRSVVASNDDAADAAGDFASGTEFGPNALALVDEDFKDFLPDPNDPKTLVQRSRAHLQGILDDLTERKKGAERRIAIAYERVNERMDGAMRVLNETAKIVAAERDIEVADAEADLAQITAAKEAINLAVARLNKA